MHEIGVLTTQLSYWLPNTVDQRTNCLSTNIQWSRLQNIKHMDSQKLVRGFVATPPYGFVSFPFSLELSSISSLLSTCLLTGLAMPLTLVRHSRPAVGSTESTAAIDLETCQSRMWAFLHKRRGLSQVELSVGNAEVRSGGGFYSPSWRRAGKVQTEVMWLGHAGWSSSMSARWRDAQTAPGQVVRSVCPPAQRLAKYSGPGIVLQR